MDHNKVECMNCRSDCLTYKFDLSSTLKREGTDLFETLLMTPIRLHGVKTKTIVLNLL